MVESTAQDKRATGWCLESTADGGKSVERVPIQNLPFRIGRLDELELTLPFQSISKHHAELHVNNDGLMLKDLASTNGTFVNRRRVEEEVALQAGDILHFAEIEFRVCTMMGFTLAQGYLYSKPVPLSEVVELGSDTMKQLPPEGFTERENS